MFTRFVCWLHLNLLVAICHILHFNCLLLFLCSSHLSVSFSSSHIPNSLLFITSICRPSQPSFTSAASHHMFSPDVTLSCSLAIPCSQNNVQFYIKLSLEPLELNVLFCFFLVSDWREGLQNKMPQILLHVIVVRQEEEKKLTIFIPYCSVVYFYLFKWS